jgi:hypothetical protein
VERLTTGNCSDRCDLRSRLKKDLRDLPPKIDVNFSKFHINRMTSNTKMAMQNSSALALIPLKSSSAEDETASSAELKESTEVLSANSAESLLSASEGGSNTGRPNGE